MRPEAAARVLGLTAEQSKNSDKVKQAFRRLASEHHPDRGGDPDKFAEANEAYRTLLAPRVCQYCSGTKVITRVMRGVTYRNTCQYCQ